MVARVLSGFQIMSTSRKASWGSDSLSLLVVASMVLMWWWMLDGCDVVGFEGTRGVIYISFPDLGSWGMWKGLLTLRLSGLNLQLQRRLVISQLHCGSAGSRCCERQNKWHSFRVLARIQSHWGSRRYIPVGWSHLQACALLQRAVNLQSPSSYCQCKVYMDTGEQRHYIKRSEDLLLLQNPTPDKVTKNYRSSVHGKESNPPGGIAAWLEVLLESAQRTQLGAGYLWFVHLWQFIQERKTGSRAPQTVVQTVGDGTSLLYEWQSSCVRGQELGLCPFNHMPSGQQGGCPSFHHTGLCPSPRCLPCSMKMFP